MPRLLSRSTSYASHKRNLPSCQHQKTNDGVGHNKDYSPTSCRLRTPSAPTLYPRTNPGRTSCFSRTLAVSASTTQRSRNISRPEQQQPKSRPFDDPGCHGTASVAPIRRWRTARHGLPAQKTKLPNPRSRGIQHAFNDPQGRRAGYRYRIKLPQKEPYACRRHASAGRACREQNGETHVQRYQRPRNR